MTAKAPVRRCAVYTRKSSEEGLEQDFNSLTGATDPGPDGPSDRLSDAGAVDLPIAWSAQKQLLGFPAASR
jgi:hypothetical protein